jgi:alpha-beta hydrolase superfamily lysophospholipase
MRLLSLLLPVLLAAQSTSAPTARVVRLSAADDTGISAAFYAPITNPAPGVILVHDYGQTRDEWSTLIPGLQRAGFAVLAFDLRGHGESTRRLTADGAKALDYHKFTPRDFQDMLLDLDAAYDWLITQPGLNQNRIAIVGAGLGANLAVRYGAFNDEVAAFFLLSPGFVYHDVRTDDVMARLGRRPVHIAVSQVDGFAYESCKRLVDIRVKAGNPSASNDFTVCTGASHGTQMLTTVKQLPALTVVWLKQKLESVAPAK